MFTGAGSIEPENPPYYAFRYMVITPRQAHVFRRRFPHEEISAYCCDASGAGCACRRTGHPRRTTWTSTGTTLGLEAVVPGGNQPRNEPCLICGTNQPQQPAISATTTSTPPATSDSYIMFSTATVGGSLGQDSSARATMLSFLRAFLLAGGDLPDLQHRHRRQPDQQGRRRWRAFAFLNLTSKTVLAQYQPVRSAAARWCRRPTTAPASPTIC